MAFPALFTGCSSVLLLLLQQPGWTPPGESVRISSACWKQCIWDHIKKRNKASWTLTQYNSLHVLFRPNSWQDCTQEIALGSLLLFSFSVDVLLLVFVDGTGYCRKYKLKVYVKGLVRMLSIISHRVSGFPLLFLWITDMLICSVTLTSG
jgi:hypothetical protein